MSSVEKTVLNLKEAALFIGFSKSYLYKKVQGMEIPYWKKGKKIMFDKSDLENWLRNE